MSQIFAHRGLHTVERENTVAAFLEAKAAGVHGVELDVRRTKDGALVVHHDAGIAGSGNICDLTVGELPHHVPTLADAMNACTGITVNVEIKNWFEDPGYDPSGAMATQVMDLLSEMKWLDDTIVSSFDLDTCLAVKKIHPAIPVGWLLNWTESTVDCSRRAADAGLDAVHPHYKTLNEGDVALIQGWGLDVNVWTVNSASSLQRMYDWGVDTIITDDPVLALSLGGATPPRP
jgi:glycerophosphoryl diester phosphodiesterase